jgi:hypothetical protein
LVGLRVWNLVEKWVHQKAETSVDVMAWNLVVESAVRWAVSMAVHWGD